MTPSPSVLRAPRRRMEIAAPMGSARERGRRRHDASRPPVRRLDLPDFADVSCGASRAADVIWNGTSGHPQVTVLPKGGNPPLVRCASVSPAPTPSGCDYFYNPATNMLSWWDLASKDVGNKVVFDWSVNGTPAYPRVLRRPQLRSERDLLCTPPGLATPTRTARSEPVPISGRRDTCFAISPTTLAQRA